MADQNKITSVLDLSDEEIMKLDPAMLSTEPAQPATSAEAEAGETEVNQPEAKTELTDKEAEEYGGEQQGDDNGDDQGTAQGAPNGAEAGTGGNGEADPAGVAENPTKANAGKTAQAPTGKPADPKPAGAPPATPVVGDASDVKAFQEKILAPFKANGREMRVENADEAIALMQKGANYHKKMEQLKPSLAIIESLRKADLLDQSKVDFLIDVMAKKPEAISKLVQDSGVDPLDLTAEKAGGYKPTSHKVSSEELAFDEVWNELEGSDGFDRTTKVVAKEWDQASQALIMQHPQLLRVINAQVQSGVYDKVAAEVNRERVLGRLTGLSDLEAYRQVGDAMEAAGKFAPQKDTAGQPNTSGQQTPAVPAVVKPDPKQAEDSNRNGQRRAASPARANPAPAKTVANPLALSDEEIMSGKFG